MSSDPTSIVFDDLELATPVLKAVQGLGYETPTAVQAQCIPHLLEGRDLLGQAQTGTGKTAAFALPLLSRIDLKQREPQVLVLAPTRELALQVSEAFQSYARHLEGFHVLPLYGGQSMSTQLRQLKRGVHVIVGTPGRVMDHLRRRTLSLKGIQALVLDEADEMLKMGFVDDIEWIFDQAPETRQVALFSATMPDAIRRVARKHLTDPMEIKVKGKTETVTTIDQRHIVVTRHHKMDALTRVLEVEEFDAMLVFVRTKTSTAEVADKLEAHGFAAEALNGDMNQTLRERTINRLKNGQLDIVVATDVAARGLDVERISHVVNFDIPNDPESYVHRIGRTGRAGREGTALMFVQPRERHLLKAIERNTRQRIPAMEMPTADDLSEHRIDRFMLLLRETLAEQDLDYYYRLLSRFEQEQEMSAMDIAAALTYLSQRERPFIVEELQTQQRGRSERPGRKSNQGRSEAPRGDREPGEGRKRKERKERPSRRDDDIPRETYRIAVGHKDGVSPREIVGAIANEAGLDGTHIGHIDISEDFSTVELPEGMPKDIFQHLRRVYVCGQKLDIELDQGSGGGKGKKAHRGKAGTGEKKAVGKQKSKQKKHQSRKKD
ncbi:ATP-dependent RNA helicase [bacterium endosymbiont of Escarpia laminata]|nr:MAG: ATP-dependent RNA helicase [bacterium endosymbiont of Escarpia laminata]